MRSSYYICAAELNEENSLIARVWVYQRKDWQSALVYDGEMTRDQMISYLKSGFSFITITNQTEQFVVGSPVRLIKIQGNEYLRTNWRTAPVDDLGKLAAGRKPGL